jgi:DNA polymerase-3 subunit beta
VNLTVERGPAATALARVTGIVEKRHTIDILANVVLTAEPGFLTLRSTDLNMEAIETIPAMVTEPGEITVPADKLHDIVRNADAGSDITMSLTDEDARLRVKSGRSNFKLPTRPAVDFPKFKDEGFTSEFAISAPLLADMLSRVIWGVSRESNNVHIENLYLTHHEGLLHATGCTSLGVALRREVAPEGSEGLRAMLPPKLVTQATKWLAEIGGDVRVSFLNRNEGRASDLIRFVGEGGSLTSRLFDAPSFVNYLYVLTEEHDLIANTDQDALKTAIRRVLVMKDQKSDTMKLSFTAGAVTLQMRNDQSGEGAEEIACDYDGPDAEVLINSRLLSDTLAQLKGDRVEIGFAPQAVSLPGQGATAEEREAYLRSVKVLVRAPVDGQYVSTLAQLRA